MRRVLLGQTKGQSISRYGAQERWDQDQPAPPPQNRQVDVQRQLSMSGHSFLALSDQAQYAAIASESAAAANRNRLRSYAAESSPRRLFPRRNWHWTSETATDSP